MPCILCAARYDIVGLDDRAAESCDGIEESAERIRALLAHEHSLGGALTVCCGPNSPPSLLT